MAIEWQDEVLELHEAFERWFRREGGQESMDRIRKAFHEDLSYIGPGGGRVGRDELLRRLQDMRGAMPDIHIEVSALEELHRIGDWLVATYHETHRRGEETTLRSTTVIFKVDPSAPRGVRWLHVHESWLER